MRMILNANRPLRAETFLSKGNLPATLDEYSRVVEADPSNLVIANSLGDLYVRAGRVQEGIFQFLAIAERYRKDGYVGKCIAMLKKISRLDPGDTATAIKIGDLLVKQGLKSEAIKQYLDAGDSSLSASKAQDAITAYERAAALDPSNGYFLMKLGEAYLAGESIQSAYEMLIKAGRAFVQKGNREEARRVALMIRDLERHHKDSLNGAQQHKRRDDRYPWRLQTVVIYETKWREYTESVDISRSGIKVRLIHPVARGEKVCVQLNMPRELVPIPPEMREAGLADYRFTADAVVSHRIVGSDGTHLIGARFDRILEIGRRPGANAAFSLPLMAPASDLTAAAVD